MYGIKPVRLLWSEVASTRIMLPEGTPLIWVPVEELAISAGHGYHVTPLLVDQVSVTLPLGADMGSGLATWANRFEIADVDLPNAAARAPSRTALPNVM